MRISTNWINDYVNIKDLNKKELAEKITNAGVNVEGVLEYNFNNLVVGEIIECSKHPGSDHLNICIVNVGKEKPYQIICGADNVKVGIKVIVSLPGAILPGDFEICERKLLGVTSCGMICALYELGLADKEETYDDGIHVLPEDAVVGDDPLKYLGIDDTIYELDLNPNRNDCLSHLGFAYEVASVLGEDVTMPDVSFDEIDENINDNFSLSVDTENCFMYLARMVKDVKIGPSPDFIKNRLEAAGMRSINNVVDISNYVMLEYGQPLHFFDKEKLGDKIVVRMANDGEKVITLDDEKRSLCADDVVITDGEKVVAVAGVMGAKNTDVDENTKDILIESAIFKPFNVRYTSLRLGLRSEAVLRFEKMLNFEYTQMALERACHLLEKYASGKVLTGMVSFDEVDKTDKKTTVSLDKINKVLGIDISLDEVKKILEQLGFNYEEKDEVFSIVIPNRRMDVAIDYDIIEEVARIYGYDKITGKDLVLNARPGKYIGVNKKVKEVSKKLRSLSLNEVKTYTLVSPEEASKFSDGEPIKLLMPMSNDKSVVRTSIVPSLIKVYEYNKARGLKDVNIYETSNVYYNSEEYLEERKLAILMSGNYVVNNFLGKGLEVDFYVIKGILENLLNYLGYENRIRFNPLKDNKDMHPGMSAEVVIDNDVIGFIGRVHPKLVKDNVYVCELSLDKLFAKKVRKIKFEDVSKYPDITKDVAFIVDKKISSSDIEKEIRKNGTKILNEVVVFDLYEGEKVEDGKKSIAYSLTFNDYTKTLKEDEVDAIFRNIITKVTSKFKCEIRDK